MMDTILPVLKELYQLNAETKCDLRGGAYCASFEPDELPDETWVQAKTDALNIAWPSSSDPIDRLREVIDAFPSSATCPDWEPEKYATLEFSRLSPESMAELIREILIRFHNLPAESSVRSEIFDMRY